MIHPALGNLELCNYFRNMGYLLSMVAHNKCGCVHTCFVHGLLICTFYVRLENYCFFTKKMKRNEKRKKMIEKKRKEKKEKRFGFEH